MPLNTSDVYVDLDIYNSNVLSSPVANFQLDKDGNTIQSPETFSFNKDRLATEPNKLAETSMTGIFKTYQ
jgi:hypothetical protein